MSLKTTRNASEYHHFPFCLSFYDYKWPWCRLACWERSISQLSVFDSNLADTDFSVWAKNSVSMRNHRVFTVQTVPNVSVSIHGLPLNEIKSFLWIPAAIEAFKTIFLFKNRWMNQCCGTFYTRVPNILICEWSYWSTTKCSNVIAKLTETHSEVNTMTKSTGNLMQFLNTSRRTYWSMFRPLLVWLHNVFKRTLGI